MERRRSCQSLFALLPRRQDVLCNYSNTVMEETYASSDSEEVVAPPCTRKVAVPSTGMLSGRSAFEGTTVFMTGTSPSLALQLMLKILGLIWHSSVPTSS